MFGCGEAVVETGRRVPCEGVARQLVDAKTWLAPSVCLVTLVWGFPFEMTEWHTLLLLVCR